MELDSHELRKLASYSLDDLYFHLGVQQDRSAHRGAPKEYFVRIGKALWRNLGTEIYKLLCESGRADEQTQHLINQLRASFDTGMKALVGYLIACFPGLPQATLIIVAAIVLRVVTGAVGKTLCEALGEAIAVQESPD